MSSPRITRSKAISKVASNADADVPTKKPKSRAKAVIPSAAVTQDVDTVNARDADAAKLLIKTVPKKPNEVCAWLLAHITEFCASDKAFQTRVLDRLSSVSWYITPEFIAVLERVNSVSSAYPGAKETLKKCVVVKLNHRYACVSRKNTLTCAQVERMYELGYFAISDLSETYVSDAFSRCTPDSVQSAIWAFKHGASLPSRQRYLDNAILILTLRLNDVEAANVANAFLTSQGILHAFDMGYSGPSVKSWKECAPFIDWARDEAHKVDLPVTMWKWHPQASWLKWLDDQGLLPAADARQIDWIEAKYMDKKKISMLQSKYGFTVEEQPEYTKEGYCRPPSPVATHRYRSDSAERAARLTGPMPLEQAKLAVWIRDNLDVILKKPELQTALTESIFGYGRTLPTDDILDALGPRGAPMLKTGLLGSRFLEYGHRLHEINSSLFQKMYALGVFTLAELRPSIVNDGFYNGRLEAVKTAIWLYKAGIPIIDDYGSCIIVKVSDVEGAAMMVPFLTEQKVKCHALLDVDNIDDVEKAKALVMWFIEIIPMAQRCAESITNVLSQSDLSSLVCRDCLGLAWLNWLTEQNLLPDNRTLYSFLMKSMRERAPEYVAELERLGFVEKPAERKTNALFKYYTPSVGSGCTP